MSILPELTPSVQDAPSAPAVGGLRSRLGGLIDRLTDAPPIEWLGNLRDNRRALARILPPDFDEAALAASAEAAAGAPVTVSGLTGQAELMLWINGPPERPFILQLGLAHDRSQLRVAALEQAEPVEALALLDFAAGLAARLAPARLLVMADPHGAADAWFLARAGFAPVAEDWPGLVLRLAADLRRLAPDPADAGGQAIAAALAFADPRALWLIADRAEITAEGPLGLALVRPLAAVFSFNPADPAALVRRASVTGDWPVSVAGATLPA